jgi:hypothetical protein
MRPSSLLVFPDLTGSSYFLNTRGPNGNGGALDSVPLTSATVRDQKEYRITFRARRPPPPPPPRVMPTVPPPPGLPARPVPIAS